MRDRGRRQTDRDVDEEDPAPARARRAGRRSAGRPRRRRRRPPPRRQPPRRALGRERAAGSAPAKSGSAWRRRLPGSGGPRPGSRRTARPRESASRREDDETDEEDPLTPEEVGDPAGGDEQCGEDDRVGVENPGEARRGLDEKLRWMSGKAMLTMNRSRLAMKTPIARTPKARQGASSVLSLGLLHATN